MFNAYNYLAAVDRIIDGDTIVITVDTGFYLKYKTQVRLLRVNAPETRGASREKGLETKEFLSKTIPGIIIKSKIESSSYISEQDS